MLQCQNQLKTCHQRCFQIHLYVMAYTFHRVVTVLSEKFKNFSKTFMCFFHTYASKVLLLIYNRVLMVHKEQCSINQDLIKRYSTQTAVLHCIC